jgi:hypothetical protein
MCLTLKWNVRLRVFEDKVLKRIFGLRREMKRQVVGCSYIKNGFIICILRQV